MATWRIIACSLAMCGIQVCYAAQINLGTSQLLLLGLSERAVSLAWLAGPLSGLIVQPIVGQLSDNCTSSLGRRRPFLIGGSIITSFALILFSYAPSIAPMLSISPLPLAISSFFLLDFAIQAIQAPLRALITDVVPRPQRALANAYIGVFTGVGNLLGGALAALRLSSLLPVFATDAEALFSLAAIILIFTVAVCVLSTSEQPLPPRYASVSSSYPPVHVNDSNPPGSETSLLSSSSTSVRGWRPIFATLRNIPRPFWQVFIVQLCTWCGFFTLFVYVNAWVGRNIFLGNGTAPAGTRLRETFEAGVRLGGRGNAFTALVTLLYSLALPALLTRFGILRVYAFSQVTEAISLMVAPLLRGTQGQSHPSFALRMATMLDIGAFGVVWATTMGVPWTIIGNALESDRRYASRVGLYTTLFNASQSGPQLLVAFIAPFILSLSHNDPSAVMFVGGLCAALGAVLVYVLRVDKYAVSEEPAAEASEHSAVADEQRTSELDAHLGESSGS